MAQARVVCQNQRADEVDAVVAADASPAAPGMAQVDISAFPKPKHFQKAIAKIPHRLKLRSGWVGRQEPAPTFPAPKLAIESSRCDSESRRSFNSRPIGISREFRLARSPAETRSFHFAEEPRRCL